MPLNNKMKAYIDEQVSAGKMTAEYAGKLSGTMADAPDDFQGAWLRQSDYDRNLAASKAEVAVANERAAKWQKWKDESEPIFNQAVAARQAAETERDELRALAASGNLTDVQENATAKQIAELTKQIQNLTGAGLITKAELDRQLADAKMSAIGFMGDFQSEMRKVEHKHFETFSKHMSPQESDGLIEFANAKAKELGRNIPIAEAYDLKYADDMRKQWETNKTAEIEKDVRTRVGVPVSSSGAGGATTLGPLQVRMEEWKGKDLVPGNDSIADAKAKAAAALRASGSY